MKNRFIILYFSLLLFLSSCNFSYEPINQSSPPTVGYNNKAIVISIPKKINKDEYINELREMPEIESVDEM